MKNEEDVLEERDESESEKDERKNPQNVIMVFDAVGESAGEDVQGGRSDISVHNSHTLKRKLHDYPQRPPLLYIYMPYN